LLLLAALVAAGVVLLLRTQWAGDKLCETLRTELPPRLGLDVSIAQCRIDPLTLSVRLSQVIVAQPDVKEPLLTTEEAEISLRNVFPGSVTLDWVRLRSPKVVLAVDPPHGGGSKQECPLRVLDHLKVQHLEVQGAQLSLTLNGKGSAELDGLDVDWRMKRGVLSGRVELKGGNLTAASGQRALLGKTLLEAELDVGDESLSLQRAEAQVEGAHLNVGGTIEALCDKDPRLSLSAQVFVPVANAVRVVNASLPAGGNLSARLTVNGKPQALAVKAEIQGSEITLANARPGDFTAKLAWSGKDLSLEDFSTKAGNGTVRISGAIKLESGLPASFKYETHDASLARILERAGIPGAWVEFAGSAKGSLTGTLAPKPNLQGDAEANVKHFVLAARPYDAPETAGPNILKFSEGNAKLHLSVLADRVVLGDINAHAGAGTHVTGEVALHYDLNEGLEVHALAESLLLSDFGSIAALPFSGQGSGRVDIKGPYQNIDLTGQVALRDFKLAGYALGVVQSPLTFKGENLSFEPISGQKGKTQFFGDTLLAFKKDGLYTRANVTVAKGGRAEDLVDVLAGLQPTLESFQNGVLTGEVAGVAHIDSPAKKLNGTIDLQLSDMRYYGRRLGNGKAALRFDEGAAMVVDSAVLSGPLGTTSAEGRWEFEGPLAFTGKVEQGALAELLGPALSVSGPFAAEAVVEGDTDMPIVNGQLTSTDVRYNGNAVGTARLDAHLKGKDLVVSGSPFADAKGQVTLHVKAPYPWEGAVALGVDDMKPYLPVAAVRQGVEGSLSGNLTGSGDLDSLDALTARAQLDHVAMSRGDYAIATQGPLVLSWAKRQLKIDPVEIKGTNTELTAEGTWGPTNADIKTHGAVDLRLLESFAPTLERTSGRLELTAAVTGPVKDPALVGSAEVRDGRFAVRDQSLQVRALEGHLEFSKSRVLFQSFEGFMNDGRVSARGDLRLDGVDMKQLEVAVDLDQVTWAPRSDLPATLTGSLLLFGKPSLYQLSGGIDVTKLHYTQGLELDAVLKGAQRTPSLITEEQKPVEWLRFDVDLACGNDVRLDNNLARAQITGKLKLSGTNLKPVLNGTLTAEPGAQATFRGNVLSIGRGVMVFNGLVPTFDLNAQAQIREYLVSIKAFGKLDDPKVSLTSQPPLAEAEVLTLLTLGITSKESVGAQSGASLVGEALFSASGLDAQVQRFFKNTVGLKDQQIHLSTTFNPATGQSEPSVSWESTVLTDKLKVGVTAPVISGVKGTKAQAEYKINDKVSARAQWDNQTQEGSSVGNPGVDLKFRFEWE
jgi:translocation and assembly module TamB